MILRPRSKVSLLCQLTVICLSICACARPPSPEESPEDPVKEAEASKPAELPPPTTEDSMPPVTLEDANKAVARVYNDVVSVDPIRNRNLVVGDFNGDGYQDIALIVKPDKARLSDINSEVANWIVKDALAPTPQVPGLARTPHTRPPIPTIGEKDDELVAVIHGFGPKGWLDDEARQSYLVRNAAGQGLKTIPRSTVIADKSMKKPALVGDVIQETLSGASGFLYYTGASYSWFNPKTARPEDPRLMVH